MTNNQRLSNEELAGIKHRSKVASGYGTLTNKLVFEDIPKLLAEIERLKFVADEVITDHIYYDTEEELNEIYQRYLRRR